MRLGLTTTPDRIRTLAPDTRRLGFEPVALPCIRIDAVPGSAENATAAALEADAIVITSPRSAAMLATTAVTKVPVIAVGPETAAAVEHEGGTVALVGSGGVRRLALDAGQVLTGKNVVLVGASNSIRQSAAALEMAGCSVTAIELYTTIPIAPDSDGVDAVAFGSPTAVTGWLIARDLSELTVAAIGGTTAAFLREHGTEPDVIPDEPGFINMIERLAALRLERSIS
jgi:uroporphyrinogen-III synthase